MGRSCASRHFRPWLSDDRERLLAPAFARPRAFLLLADFDSLGHLFFYLEPKENASAQGKSLGNRDLHLNFVRPRRGAWGLAMGARYLIFVLPLLLDSFFGGEADDFSNIWQGFLFTLSLWLCTIPALTFPFAPPEFRFPHANFWRPLLVNEHWFTPTLANVFGWPSTILAIAPVLGVLLIAICTVCLQARRPERFAVGILAGFIGVGIYSFLPNLDEGEAQFRRATIAERFFKPANRLLEVRRNAKARNDWQTLQKINAFEWTIADARASAPDDFPYLEVRELTKSPSLQMKKAALLQQQGKTAEAEAILQSGKSEFPFARCEFSTGLAVVYYATKRKEGALTELKDIQPLVDQASGAECLRSQFLLGSLYQEMNQRDDAREAFRKFLQNSENSDDAQIKLLRRGLGAK
jgi:tetratricopeptide (TPR) repeat protein